MSNNLDHLKNIFKCLNMKNDKGLKIILYLKQHEDCNVQDIYRDLQIDQVTTSIILKLLKECNLVEDTRVKRYRKYKIIDETLLKILDLVIEKMDQPESKKADEE